MADIFISYSRDDLALVEPVANLLEQQGWSVWWDTELLPGQQWNATIERELNAATCVVVAWSSNSIQSRWVIAEAEIASNQRKFVPIKIEQIRQPIQFRLIQAQDFATWNGFADELQARTLLKAVRTHLKLEANPTRMSNTRTILAIAAGLIIWLLAGIIPAASIYLEHGSEVLWRVIQVRPHYFIFHLTFFPVAGYFLMKCMMSAWFDQFTKAGRFIFLAISVLLGLGLVALDHEVNPTYIEIRPEVLAQNDFLQRHFLGPVDNSADRKNYQESLRDLSKKNRTWWILSPYYVGSFLQFSYWILLVVTLGLVSFSQSRTSYVAAISILYSGAMASTWLLFYAAFLGQKLKLYEIHMLSSAIYLGFAILIFVFISAWIISKRYMKYNIHQYAVYVILIISVMIFFTLVSQSPRIGEVKLLAPESRNTLLIAFPVFVLLFLHPIFFPFFQRKAR